MAELFRICLFVVFLFTTGCVSQDEARNERGLPSDEASQIPAATPGPGWEKVQKRPDATPTPPPTNPIERPLDPTGLPQG